MDQPLPLTRELVFIGGGHTHALVLRRWGMRALPGARVTVINPGATAPYTGMLPGFVAGHYDRDALSIDLVRLARFAGARLILGAVQGIDLARREIHVPGRPPVPFDVASVNVGITSDLPTLPGFATHAIAAKPLDRYAARWIAFRQAVEDQQSPPDIAVIGGGVGGVELSLAMAHALRAQRPKITVIERGGALPGLAAAARGALMRKMTELGVTLLEGAEPVQVSATQVQLRDGRAIPSRLTVGVAGARPHPWIKETGLAHNDGFLTVRPTLETSDPAIFAAGDCAVLPDPRPKAGVFAVREAPTLFHNLRAAVAETGGLRAFRPQRDYLKLVSLGAKSAVADKWGGRLQGAWVWRWKDRIDRRFMDQFTDLAPMAASPLPPEHAAGLAEVRGLKPMCGGCGAKVGGAVLSRALADHGGAARSDVISLPGDDAALVEVGRTRQVLTTDHLRAITEDPYVMAKIAAVHALGDIWAMGAAPQAALATIILPRLSEHMQHHWLAEIMAGASEVMSEAGAAIVGGHTSVGHELTIGFGVTGRLDRAAVTLAGAQPGDALVLTKPIGFGTLLAGEMQLAARGDWVAAALEVMMVPQAAAARVLSPARAMTDVTGFGLAGHLLNICQASGVGALLALDRVPLIAGAEALASQGVRSTLYAANRAYAAAVTAPMGARADLLFDPQTAGGLLAAVPRAALADILRALDAAGYPAREIGEITAGPLQIVAE